MLTSPTTANGHSRIRPQHRRQNSIPVALESAKNSGLASQRYGIHKRGTSLDQRPRSAHVESAAFREALQSQIGDLDSTQPYLDLSTLNVSSDGECSPFEPDGLGGFTNQNSSSSSSSNDPSSTFNMQSGIQHTQQQQQSTRTSTSFASNMDFPGTSHSRNSSDANSGMLAISGGITPKDLRRLSIQSSQSAGRPSTPLKQTGSNSLPITPEPTPIRQNMNFFPDDTMSMQSSQPAYMRRAQSLQGYPGYAPTQTRIDVPSPPNTAPGDCENFDMLSIQESEIESCTFDEFMRASTFSNDKSQTDNSNNNNSNSNSNDSQSRPSSSESSSIRSSPETASIPPAESNRDQQPTNNKNNNKVPITPGPTSKKPTATTSASRSSMAKTWLSPKPASIDSLKLDSRVQASIAETGVTIEEIASYISGPDPEDGQYVCLYNDCRKRFGRKENIKSHVQTHLGDRQYKCDLCKKCFVRGHDLKRHAKIHTGDKPYECACGNVFARHDALTRHRQRGMCIGGYKGVVRKPNKRGRPRKNDRPDMEQRLEKAARARQKVLAKAPSSSLSDSGNESRSSSPPTTSSSPESTIHFQVSSPTPVPNSGCDNAATNGSSSSNNNNNFCMPSDVFSMTPPASPGYSTGNNNDSKYLSSSSHSEQRPFTPCTDSGSDIKTDPEQMRQGNFSTLLVPFSGDDTANYLNLDMPTTNIPSLDSSLSTSQTVPTLMDSTTATSDLDLMMSQDHSHGLPDFGATDSSSNFSDFGASSNFMDEFFKGSRNSSSLGASSELFLEYGDESSCGSFVL